MKVRLLLLTIAFISLSAETNASDINKIPANDKQYDALFRVGTFSGNPDGYCKAVFIGQKKYMIRLNSSLDYVISIEDWYSGSDCTNILAIINIVQDDDYNPTVEVNVTFDDPYYEYLGWGLYYPEYGIIYSDTETYFPWGSSGQ
jgi:hypothetical protein